MELSERHLHSISVKLEILLKRESWTLRRWNFTIINGFCETIVTFDHLLALCVCKMCEILLKEKPGHYFVTLSFMLFEVGSVISLLSFKKGSCNSDISLVVSSKNHGASRSMETPAAYSIWSQREDKNAKDEKQRP